MHPQAGEGVADAAGQMKGGLDVQELGRLQDVTAGCVVDHVADVTCASEGEVGLEFEGAAALGGEALSAQHLSVVGGGLEVEGEAARAGEGAQRRQSVDDLAVLQGVQGLGGHISRPMTREASRWRSGMFQ